MIFFKSHESFIRNFIMLKKADVKLNKVTSELFIWI
jgi:hypothetical protein